MKKLMSVVFVLVFSQMVYGGYDANLGYEWARSYSNKLNKAMGERVDAMEDNLSERIVKLNERLMKEIKTLKEKTEKQEKRIQELEKALKPIQPTESKEVQKTEAASELKIEDPLLKYKMENIVKSNANLNGGINGIVLPKSVIYGHEQ